MSPRFICLVLVALLISSLVPAPALVVRADDGGSLRFIDEVVERDDGSVVVAHIAPLGPPEVLGFKSDVPSVDLREAEGSLTDVPAYDWCYGCSATSAAMLFGYYDRTGYPGMYTGPANGGVCPLNNYPVWGAAESPLSATHEGIDDLSTRGHVDDYWAGYLSHEDPYFEHWTEHGYADCTADFMGTSQWENWYNADGSTTFYFSYGNQPLYDYTGGESGTPARRDGCHGMRLFAESRGYTVLYNYNQYIAGYGGNPDGFTYEQFKGEIDTGRPVMIQVDGHSMLGVGYDDPDTIYVHDTWDHQAHPMAWGGAYGFQELQHYGVTVIRLEPLDGPPEVTTDAASSVEETTTTLNGSLEWDGGSDCEYRFSYGTAPGSYGVSTTWGGSLSTGDEFDEDLTGLDKGETYYFIAEARNGDGESSGAERHFTTKPDAPSGLSATAAGTDSIDLEWSAGDGAEKTRVQRATEDYPSSPTDGTTVYFDSGVAATDSGLEPETTYYYRAWSHVEGSDIWSDGHVDAQATTGSLPYPEVTTEAATLVTDSSAQLNALLADDGGETCDYRFQHDIDSGEPYASATAWTDGVTIGQTFDEAVSGLDAGTTYYFRAQAQNGTGIGSGGELSFTTKPGAPTGLLATTVSTEAIDLSWTLGDGSTETLIMRKTGDYPADRTDGEQAYLGSAASCNDSGLQPGTLYYYRAWSHVVPGDQWCDGCSEATAQTEGVLISIPIIGMPPDASTVADVTIDGAADLAAATIVLDFDPDVVHLTAFESGDLGDVVHNSLSEANSTGQLTMSWSSVTGSTGDFAFAAITIEGVGDSGESTALDLTVSVLADSEGTPLAHEVEDGSVTLLSLMEGDVNLDGSTNIVDAMFVAQYTVGIISLDADQMIAADTTDDGNVNIIDAMHIAQFTVDPTGSGGVLFKALWESPADDGLLNPL